MSTIRVLIAGYRGKMGQTAQDALCNDPDFEIVPGAQSTDQLQKNIHTYQPDVVLDLTTAKVVQTHVQLYLDLNVKSVIGASGLSQTMIKQCQQQCIRQSLGMFIVPNFSLGMALMQQCAEIIAQHMPHAEIIETHHTQKIDSPSGTALDTARLIDDQMAAPHHPHHQSRGDQTFKTPIHALRLPHAMANQDVIFSQPGESLTLSHQCLDRHAYHQGIRKAIRYCINLSQCDIGLQACLK
ncbi:MAG: 4-hydroxy-tetrahydrodipicolinate reductase [Candidatus Comchoanobacterales bacterium]